VFHAFWNAFNEHVMSCKLFFVRSEQLFIELQSTALLSIDFEVSHGLACLLKLNWVFDVYNG
jgi:hypothetical protein